MSTFDQREVNCYHLNALKVQKLISRWNFVALILHSPETALAADSTTISKDFFKNALASSTKVMRPSFGAPKLKILPPRSESKKDSVSRKRKVRIYADVVKAYNEKTFTTV